MAHDSAERNQGLIELGGTEPFDITFYNRPPEVGGQPTNPDGYTPGTGPNYNDPSPHLTVSIQIYDSSAGTLIAVPAGYVAPTVSNLRYAGSTGRFLVDITTTASTTLTTGLASNHSWAVVWDTTMSGVALGGLSTAETFQVITSGGVSHGPALYCSVPDIAGFMTGDRFTFDANTNPGTELVESSIRAAMDEIDAITHRTWRGKAVEGEMRNIQRGWGISDYFGSFKLAYSQKGVRTITKLEVWTGASYKDITSEEGRTSKWYADLRRGIVYLRGGFVPIMYRNSVRVSYIYGETEVPHNVKMACILLTGWYLLQSEDYTLLFPEGSEHMRLSEKQELWKQRAYDLLQPERRGMVWS